MNPRKKVRMLVPVGPPAQEPTGFKRVLIFLLMVLVRPVLLVLGAVFKFFFGWMDGSSIARKNQQQFAQEIEGQLKFLFNDHGAKIVPNDPDVPFPPSFDGAYITIATDSVRFRFTQGRGDFLVEVAPLTAPMEWENLELVLATIPDLPIQVGQRDFWYLRTLAKILPPVYLSLCHALQENRCQATLDAAAGIHNERMEQRIATLKQNGIVPKVFWTT